MTGPIVRAIEASREDAAPPAEPDPPVLALMPDEPKLPSAAELAAAMRAARPATRPAVPAGVEAGPTNVADVLDWLTPAIEAILRKLEENDAGGFVVTAADHQRRTEVMALLAKVQAILAERQS